jgi:hypothetical protein
MKARRVIFRVFAGLVAAIVIPITGLMLTFTAAKLEVPRVEVRDRPPASPPAGMSISALPTGSYENRAAFAFPGGSWNDIRHFSMTALLVRHPKGNLLIDAGTGKNVDEHVKVILALVRSASQKYTQIHLLPAHDSSAFRMIPVFPALAR